MNLVIWFIHGAVSTELSFTWLKEQLSGYDQEFLSYDAEKEDISLIVSRFAEKAKQETRDIIVIAHSLGGVIGAGIAQLTNNVKKLITMSTPFGGSQTADMMQWVIRDSVLYKNIASNNFTLQKIRVSPPKIPTLCFITYTSTNILGQKHDGVVSVNSQESLPKAKYEYCNLNHFEVLLSPTVADKIRTFIV